MKKINKKKTIKQLHTIKHYLVIQTIIDVLSKGVTMAVSTYFVLYIFMEGSGDYALILVSNIMFTCGCPKAHDKYLDEHISAIKEIIIKLDQARSIALKENEDELQQPKISITFHNKSRRTKMILQHS